MFKTKKLATIAAAISLTACGSTAHQPSFNSQMSSVTNRFSDLEMRQSAYSSISTNSLDEKIVLQTEVTKTALLIGPEIYSLAQGKLEDLITQKPLHLRSESAMALIHLHPLGIDERVKNRVVTNKVDEVVSKRCSPKALQLIRGKDAIAERELAFACAKLLMGDLQKAYEHLQKSLTLKPNQEFKKVIAQSHSLNEAIVRITAMQIAKDQIDLSID
ncbi:MAG: hypothetical protein HRT51_09315 [Colwellia sp.]|nr:hypothetical protein [Colwellia sp.]